MRRASTSEIGIIDRQHAAQPFRQEIFSPCFSRARSAIPVTASASALAKGNNWINRLGPAGAEIVVFSFQSAATNSTPIATVSEF
jgi:hypothetical protein